MRFIIITLFAFLPLNAMADDSALATVGDIDDLFELIQSSEASGNTCTAENVNTGITCSVACPATMIAYCLDVTAGRPICECNPNRWDPVDTRSVRSVEEDCADGDEDCFGPAMESLQIR